MLHMTVQPCEPFVRHVVGEFDVEVTSDFETLAHCFAELIAL